MPSLHAPHVPCSRQQKAVGWIEPVLSHCPSLHGAVRLSNTPVPRQLPATESLDTPKDRESGGFKTDVWLASQHAQQGPALEQFTNMLDSLRDCNNLLTAKGADSKLSVRSAHLHHPAMSGSTSASQSDMQWTNGWSAGSRRAWLSACSPQAITALCATPRTSMAYSSGRMFMPASKQATFAQGKSTTACQAS